MGGGGYSCQHIPLPLQPFVSYLYNTGTDQSAGVSPVCSHGPCVASPNRLAMGSLDIPRNQMLHVQQA